MATLQATNLIMTPARMLYAPIGTTLPADTLAAGAAWPVGWVEMGFTKEPFAMIVESDETDFKIEQALGAVNRHRTDLNVRFETVLAELEMSLLALMLGGTVATTPPGASQTGIDELSGGGVTYLTQRMFGVEGSYPNATGVILAIRFYLYRATAKLNGNLELGRTVQTGLPIQINALEDMSRTVGDRVYLLQEVTAPVTA